MYIIYNPDPDLNAFQFHADAADSVSVRAAALAMEKPGGDTLSDSALGRSSYTASIAGMTTFSEVSQILWKRLWSMNIIDFLRTSLREN